MKRSTLAYVIVLAAVAAALGWAAQDPARPALPSGTYRVEDFGAVADGKTDCYDAIAAAIAATQRNIGPDRNGGGVIQFAAGVYLTSKELDLPLSDSRVRLVGLGRDVTVLRASAPMRSVLRWANDSEMAHMSVEGARLAESVLRIERGALSKFTDCAFRRANFDGIRLTNTAGGINDAMVFEDCVVEYNGRLYRSAGMPAFSQQPSVVQPGTVSLSAGSAIVTGQGTRFTAIPYRVGDPIRVGDGGPADFFGMVQSVEDDTHLTLQALWLPTADATAKDYLLGLGSGYSEDHGSDNNINRIRGGLYRCNAGHGLLIDGLYGDTLDSLQVDGNGFAAICVGRGDGQSNPIGTVISHPYMEGNPLSWWASAGVGLTILQPNRGTREMARVARGRALGQVLDHEGIHSLFDGDGQACTLTAVGAPAGPPGPQGPPGPAGTAPPRRRIQAQATIPRNQTAVVVEHGLGGQPAPEDVGVVLWSGTRVWLAECAEKTLTFRTDVRAPNGGITFTYSASRQP